MPDERRNPERVEASAWAGPGLTLSAGTALSDR
jgi:hypothetical protein